MLIPRRSAMLAGVGSVLAGCSAGMPSGVPDIPTRRLESGSFRSHYRPTDVGWAVSCPPGHTGALPVLVFLHGRGGDHDGAFGGSLHHDKFLAAAVAHG